MPVLDLRVQVAVGRGDDAHVDGDVGLAADRAEPALLQDAQQLHLQVQRQLADLVEEERAAVGAAEAARAVGDGAGEGAAHVAEELALDQVSRGWRRS